jgi:antitoxin component of MazEF toxin-antitoxin module
MKQHSKKLSENSTKGYKKAGKYNLAEMVSRMPKDYKVEEVSLGKPVGKEVW